MLVPLLLEAKMALAGNQLLIVGNDVNTKPKLAIADVTNPSSPIVLGTLILNTPNTGKAISVAVKGNKVVVGIEGDSDLHISIVDISNASAPVERGSLNVTGVPTEVKMSADGHYAFVTDNTTNILRVVDVSDSTNPVQVTSVPLPSRAIALTTLDNTIYVAGGYSVLAVDMSIPVSPVLKGSYTAPCGVPNGLYGITAVKDSVHGGDIIYVGDQSAGLVVLKTKDTQAPQIFITDPTFSATYSTASGSINLGGGALDNVGVVRVTWTNSRGGGGNATGTGSWVVSGITLQPGANVLTVTAFDQAGN